MNSPINYNDPSGHFPGEQQCYGLDGYGQPCNGPLLDGNWSLDDFDIWVFGVPGVNDHKDNRSFQKGLAAGQEKKKEQRKEVCGTGDGFDICLEIMPPGAEKSAPGDHDSAEDLHEVGLVIEMIEIALAGSQFGEPWAIIAAFVDLGVTLAGCVIAGDCYIGSPGYGLPPMVVMGQDVVVTGGDFVIGTLGVYATVSLGPGTVDTVTSGYSFVYDWGRLYNDFETYVNVGWSPFTPKRMYILIYPP